MKSEQNSQSGEQNQQDPSRQLFSSSFAKQNPHSVPEITLPKGGGALRGMDEKIEVNPVNGTSSIRIPLPIAPARSGFSPDLSLQYNSGSGNGLFGLGWHLNLPSIRRKTDKELPQYKDHIDSDTYLLAGLEDLVPQLEQNNNTQQWQPKEQTISFNGIDYQVKHYRPRIEGAWLRIERWTHPDDGTIHWRTIDASNVITVYGADEESRIADPKNPRHIFEWLIAYSYDNKGNLIQYEYKEENLEGVTHSLYEKNRNISNRYLKRILYGNKKHYKHGDALPLAPENFLFETVLDYGEHDQDSPTPKGKLPSIQAWEARSDAFSSFRSGFDIRTYRYCKRVLLFHRFVDEQTLDAELVASLDLTYSALPDQVVNHQLEGFTYLREATTRGYMYDPTDKKYKKDSKPPLSFDYQAHAWNTTIQQLDETALNNAPTGINNSGYQWMDLYGEGLSGILLKNSQAWYYKQNLGQGQFSAAALLHEKPSMKGFQFQSLEGNSEKQLVNWSGVPQGFFEYNNGATWQGFQPFEQVPNRLLSGDPYARFIDLDGDGRPDLLITEEDLFQWYPSLGKKGFGKANRIALPLDEEEGPRIVFADPNQSIYLADMTGDGMTDIVRIQNGAVCYWANMGYGQFSAKITMANAPLIEREELFHPRDLQLVDIDGSGTTDIAYLYKDSIQIWMNHNGNRFVAAPKIIHPFPLVDDQVNIDIVDLLGNGTACIVWSSAQAKDQNQPLRYIDLTNGIKPHLLYQYKNNTGGCVQWEYKPSTYYYLEDQKAGKPWATKLPFPVHVVNKITSIDYISKLVFTQQYSYHHGYYDALEREFRGFGRVETLDTEVLDQHNLTINPTNHHPDHYQVPIKTISWYHTGASFNHQTLTDHYQTEYFQHPDPSIEQPLNSIQLPSGLSDPAYHEAFRACKGQLLRQEIYTLDLDNFPKSTLPYQCSASGYALQQIQPKAGQKYACFLVVPTESIAYNYERNPADPRIEQNLVLATDDFGIPTQTAQIIYPRLDIPVTLPDVLKEAQQKIHATYSELSLTNRVDDDHAYRLQTVWEDKLYEVLNLTWQKGDAYFTPVSFLTILKHPTTSSIDFSEEATTPPAGAAPNTHIQKRLSGHGKALFIKDNLTQKLGEGVQESLGIPYQSYQLVSTPSLRRKLYTTPKGTDLLAQSNLDIAATSHYKEFTTHKDWWWLPSSTSIYLDPSIASTTNFYLPDGIQDVAGNRTRISYDSYRLFPKQINDPLDNTTSVEYDYRVLQPKLMIDPNENHTAVAFDALGIVVKSAMMGKALPDGGYEGDTLEHPTASMTYDFKQWLMTHQTTHPQPNYIRTQVRETHKKTQTRWQESYEYTDGMGNVIMTKVQANDGLAQQYNPTTKKAETVDTRLVPNLNRWIGNGRTILNNKGKPIKQYEPYFSVTADFEAAPELVEIGYSPILYYDALGRNIRTEMPNGTFTKVEFDAWKVTNYDVNDTIADPSCTWQAPSQRIQTLVDQHTNTPMVTYLDCLGRPILVEDAQLPAPNATNTRLHTATDLAGRHSTAYDQIATQQLITSGSSSRGYSSYSLTDMLGQAVYNESAVKGSSYQFMDALGRVTHIWDNPDHKTANQTFWTHYDRLHRPTATYVQQAGQSAICFAQTAYGATHPNAIVNNLKGQAYQIKDQSGILTTHKADFKGNPLRMTRQLTEKYDVLIDWDDPPTLEPTIFETSTTYDALNRPIQTTLPDETILRSSYNKGGILEHLEGAIGGGSVFQTFLEGQDYDAKGQKQWVRYGNGTLTQYFYEAKTFRLSNLLTVHTANPNEKLQDLHYAYDPIGNVMAIKDDAQSTAYYNNQAISPIKQYEYDHLYRLTRATGRAHVDVTTPSHKDLVHLQNLPHQHINNALHQYTQSYTYDAVGNILSMDHKTSSGTGNWTRNYRYASDATNQLHQTTIGGQTYNHKHYDRHGNMTQMPHLQALSWNFADQLAQVTLNTSGDVAHYNYDAEGQRTRKVLTKNGKKRQERIYLGGIERYRAFDWDGKVQTETWTLQLESIALVETKTIDNSTPIAQPKPLIRYQYSDHLGSATLETDAKGQVISYEEYHPYGTTAYSAYINASYSTKRYRYINQERDEETGLYSMGVRYYAPWLGRWTSSDPADFVDGLNLYRYSRNNPVNLVDPGGMEPDPPKSKYPKNGKPIVVDGKLVEYEMGDGQGFTHVAAHLNDPKTQKEFGYVLDTKIDWKDIAFQVDNFVEYSLVEFTREHIAFKDATDANHDAWRSLNLNEGDILKIPVNKSEEIIQSDEEIEELRPSPLAGTTYSSPIIGASVGSGALGGTVSGELHRFKVAEDWPGFHNGLDVRFGGVSLGVGTPGVISGSTGLGKMSLHFNGINADVEEILSQKSFSGSLGGAYIIGGKVLYNQSLEGGYHYWQIHFMMGVGADASFSTNEIPLLEIPTGIGEIHIEPFDSTEQALKAWRRHRENVAPDVLNYLERHELIPR